MSHSHPPHLPRPSAASPTPPASAARPTVVYDGQCPFCLRQVDKMKRRDNDGAFDYLPRRTEGIERRFPKLAEGDFNTGMRLAYPDGTVRVGADAVYAIARRLRGWRNLAWLYRVPGLRGGLRAAYRWVARNRGQLSRGGCGTDACER